MKRYMKTLAAAFLIAGAGAALAQVASPPGTIAGGAINQTVYDNNTDSAGFRLASVTAAGVALATSTAQATFTRGAVLTGQVIGTKNFVITTCSGTTGFTLPAVERFEAISVFNRSGGSCLIWPSIGATVETALGTDGATNAAFTMLTNTDVTFRPISATRWLQ